MHEDLDDYVKTDLNGAKGTLCLEIIGPTTQEENLTVHDVAASDVVHILQTHLTILYQKLLYWKII